MRNKKELINILNNMEQHCFAQGLSCGEAGDTNSVIWWRDSAGVYKLCSHILIKHDIPIMLNVVNELLHRKSIPAGVKASLLIIQELAHG